MVVDTSDRLVWWYQCSQSQQTLLSSLVDCSPVMRCPMVSKILSLLAAHSAMAVAILCVWAAYTSLDPPGEMTTFEPFACSVTAKEAISEPSACSAMAKVAILKLSACYVMTTEGISELSALSCYSHRGHF